MDVDTDRPIRKTGILGGTFDPIHNGHLAIAKAARGCLGLDRVVFIPAGRPWLKARSVGQVTDAEHRLAMVRLAIANCPHFEASAMEIERPGLTYTVDTLADLRARDGGSPRRTEMYLILGMDSMRELRRWHEPERLFEMCVVIAVSRPDTDDITPSSFEQDLPAAADRFRLLRGPLLDISATDIRNRVAEGRTIDDRVPVPRGAVHPRARSLPRNVVSCASQTHTPWRCVGDE